MGGNYISYKIIDFTDTNYLLWQIPVICDNYTDIYDQKKKKNQAMEGFLALGFPKSLV